MVSRSSTHLANPYAAHQLAASVSPRGHLGGEPASASHCPLQSRPTAPKESIAVVAFGDIHGCFNLLEQELRRHEGGGAELIFLGDLIDRSPEPDGDQGVIELVRELQANPEAYGLAGVTVLRGNHEQMLLDAIAEEGENGPATELWEWNGGDTKLLPFYRQHITWFEALPLTAIRGQYLFVHAGVRPGVPLEQQSAQDLTWIRAPFLTHPHGLPYTVVHGHSITRDHTIERLPHRINLDTGAFCSGVLSSLRLEPSG